MIKLTKNCPKCGKQVPDNAKFCMDCGYSFESNETNGKFSLSTLFIILIAAVLIIGGVFILTSGSGNNSNSGDAADDVDHVDLTISDVLGWENSDDSDSKPSYTLYTEAIFNSVPNDMKGYNIKTRYFDSNDTEIGHETETLENVYYESDYALSFGHYTTYKLPDVDHVTVEIIKSGKVIDSYTEKIDKSKIDFLN